MRRPSDDVCTAMSGMNKYSLGGRMRAILRIVSIAMVMSIMVGCISYQPKQYQVEREFVVKIERAEVASRLQKWMTKNGFNITENSQTIISATANSIDQMQGYKYDGWSGVSYSTPVVDCGRKPLGFGAAGAQLTVVMESDRIDIGAGTRVTVNFSPGIDRTVVLTCVSNGTVESMIKKLLTESK
jgi:hypothetical protein